MVKAKFKIIDYIVKENQLEKFLLVLVWVLQAVHIIYVKENNYLGKGIAVNAFASISSESF